MGVKNMCMIPELDASSKYGEGKYSEEEKTILDSSKTKTNYERKTSNMKSSLSLSERSKNALVSLLAGLDGSKYANIIDAAHRVFHKEHISSSVDYVDKRLRVGYGMLNGDDRKGSAIRYQRYTSMRNAKFMLDSNVELEKIPGYKELLEKNPSLTYDEFANHINSGFEKAREDMINDPIAFKAHQSINAVKYELIKKINELYGKDLYDLTTLNPHNVDEQLYNVTYTFIKLSESDENRIDLEKRFNNKIEDLISNPKLHDVAICHLLDMAVKRIELRNELAKYDVSHDFKATLAEELSKEKTIDESFMKSMDPNHVLNKAYSMIIDTTGIDVDEARLADTEGKYDNMNDVEVLNDLMKNEMFHDIINNKGFLNDTLLHSFIDKYPIKFKEMSKLLRGEMPNRDALLKEIDTLIKTEGISGTEYLGEYKNIRAKREIFNNAVKEYTGERSDNLVERLKTMYPGHVILNLDGTRLFDVNGKPIKIEDAKFIPGNITGILTPAHLAEDIINSLAIEEYGDDYINSVIKNGDFMVVPEEIAKVFDESKKPTLPDHFRKSTIYKISTFFRKNAIMSPFRILKYSITGMLGNVYWSLLAHPGAFGNWGIGFKMAQAWFRGDFYEKYGDHHMAKVFEETAKHTGTQMGIDLKELGIDIDSANSLLSNDTDIPKKRTAFVAWGKLMELTGKFVEFRELWHRSALAMAHYDDMMTGKFSMVNMIGANMDRINGITDPARKAAVLAHEQFIDYSDISRMGRRLNATMLMFWTFKEGMIKNHYRQFKGIYQTMKEGFKTGDSDLIWGAGKKLAITTLVMGGVLSMVWNLVMKGLGLIKDDEYDRLKKATDNTGIRKLFGGLGLPGDGFVYLPGTNIKAVDHLFGIGRDPKTGAPIANRKFNIAEGIPAMIPGLNGQGMVDTLNNQIVASMNPVYKVPIQYAQGGSFITDSSTGDVTFIKDKNWATKSTAQKVAETASEFWGANEVVSSLFNKINGAPNGPRDGSMEDLQFVLQNYSKISAEQRDPHIKSFEVNIEQGMKSGDTEYTVDAIANYIKYMQENWKPDPAHPNQTMNDYIKRQVMYVIRQNNIITGGNDEVRKAFYEQNPDYASKLPAMVQKQIELLKAIGINPSDL